MTTLPPTPKENADDRIVVIKKRTRITFNQSSNSSSSEESLQSTLIAERDNCGEYSLVVLSANGSGSETTRIKKSISDYGNGLTLLETAL